MRLLVTGGAGFIGSNFIRYVLTEYPGVQVTNLDLLTYAGNPASLRDLEDRADYTFVQGDICAPEVVDRLMADTDAVVNFAAESHVDRSIDGPAEFLRTNVSGAGMVFDAARRHEVEQVLHISTDEVYGSIAAPRSSQEGDPLEPNSPYSASKASADLLARAYRETYGLPITVTRTTNNFGPYHYPEKAIPLFVTNLIDDGRIPLYGKGDQVRDWLFVRDNAAAQWVALTEGTPGDVYNVGAGNEMTNRELTLAILDRFGLGEERIDHVTDRPGHDLRYSVNTGKITGLGWQPTVSFEQALDATIDWYRNNEWWWRPLKEAGASARRGAVSQASSSRG